MTNNAVTLKTKLLLFIWPLALITLGYGVIIFALISNGKAWFAVIPIALLVASIRKILIYYLNIEPEMIEADKKAGEGTWKIVAVAMLVITLSVSAQMYFRFSQKYMEWVMLPILTVSIVIYILLRQRKFHRDAKEKIERRKLREQESLSGVTHD